MQNRQPGIAADLQSLASGSVWLDNEVLNDPERSDSAVSGSHGTTMTGADALVDCLASHDVRHIFGMPESHSTAIYEALAQTGASSGKKPVRLKIHGPTG